MENILLRARKIRQLLHIFPELSGEEVHTACVIRECIQAFEPDEVIDNLGGNGIAFIYKGKESGKTLLFRADMDAVPVEETNRLLYASRNKGVAHMCGHDGHMAILAGLADMLHQNPIKKGSAILLFQPAEENGQGAKSILEDERMKKRKIDYVFALHNLPGYPKGSIINKNGVFASASKGMVLRIKGLPAHAAYPEYGISPVNALVGFIQELQELPHNPLFSGMVMITIVHIRMGDAAFGVSPSDAVIMTTLRCTEKADMALLSDEIQEKAALLCDKEHLKFTIEWTDEFIPTVNNSEAVDFIDMAAQKNNYSIINPDLPFRWSEDFGQFTFKYKGAMFGLGAGEECKPLHSAEYNFPDELIEVGINMFYRIIQQITIG